jgi:hypothetical protein
VEELLFSSLPYSRFEKTGIIVLFWATELFRLFASVYFGAATTIVAAYDAQNGKIRKIEGITESNRAVRLGGAT